jgi:ketosteroid isomerase-like protein
MGASSAREVDRLFVRAMNDGDIETIMSLYTPETVFVQAPGSPTITGMDALRKHLQQFLDLRPRLSVELKQFVEAKDVAFFSVRWELEGIERDGTPIAMSGIDGNIVHRGYEGSWTTLIDNPFHREYLGV